MSRIIPTNGRVMLYHPNNSLGEIVQHDRAKPLTAHVVHVWGEDMVNLVVFDSNGNMHKRTSVPIVQEGSPFTAGESSYCEWMPYQKGQAAKREAAEAKLAGKVAAVAAIMLAAASVFAPAPARAADVHPLATMPVPAMPVKAPAAPALLAGSGFYVGGNFGAAASSQAFDFITLPGTGNMHPAGVMTGLTLGFGGSCGGAWCAIEIEGDYDFTHAETACAIGDRCGTHNSWWLAQKVVLAAPLSSMTGAASKLGIAAPQQLPIPLALPTNFLAATFMPGVVLGLAERNVRAYVVDLGQASQWMVGPLAGVVLRQAITTGWTAKLEADAILFNKHFEPSGNAPGVLPATFKSLPEYRAMLGADYHF